MSRFGKSIIRRARSWSITACAVLLLCGAAPAARANELERDLGRNEVRVYSRAFPLVEGLSVVGASLPDRLERLGYRRVRERPASPGEYFWGNEVFWIFQRDHRVGGRDYPAQLVGLSLTGGGGTVSGAVHPDGTTRPISGEGELWIEPELLAESLDERRARRVPVELEDLPRHVWRAVLAAEDARFFDHVGLDGIALARALLANVKAGRVVQGGSTITQQLIKNRALSPRRTLGRKASEALRALALESEHEKEDILESYLNHVYMGHVDGVAVHGIGTASSVYFAKPASLLSLAQAATLAAMIQGPNRLSPLEHPQRVRERRDWVLERMAELDWAGREEVSRALAAPVRTKRAAVSLPPARHFLGWIAAEVERLLPRRTGRGRGVVVETTLDPWLQDLAEREVARHLEAMRSRDRGLRGAGLSAALVSLDARSGGVLAYVGGDPRRPGDDFDRVRRSRRQAGSTIKPLVLLEAFDGCGARAALNPATRVADEPLTIERPDGVWRPENYDRRFHGVVSVRAALRHSYNVPFVRLARWCGLDPLAERLQRAGLAVPSDPAPSLALGAVDVSPLELASAYTVFATPGRRRSSSPITRIEKPSGRRLAVPRGASRRIARRTSAWLVRELMHDTVERGTGRPARIDGIDVAGKTGSSSGLRDAWFAGEARGVISVVWLGLDRDGRLGRTGSQAAAPLWREYVRQAAGSRPAGGVEAPRGIVERRVDPETGLLKSRFARGGAPELFRRGAVPRTDRVLRKDSPSPVIR